MTSRIERQIEWRRSNVLELDSQGHTQSEIALRLQVSVGTVNNDLSYLREQAKYRIGKYIDENLPHEYEKCLIGLNLIQREAWNTAQSTEDPREKVQALSLAKECYGMKLDLLTNASVVDDAIRFVSNHNNAAIPAEKKDGTEEEREMDRAGFEEENFGRKLDTSSITNQTF